VAADLGITRGLKSSFLLKDPKTSDETEDLGALVLLFLTMTYSIISSSSSDELYSGYLNGKNYLDLFFTFYFKPKEFLNIKLILKNH
jgi:hypothetical protein